MILELEIYDPERTPVEWWPKVEAFKGTSRFAFRRDGLTVLWGPNGSGKSTMLRMLARLTHCEQGGTPKVTQSSVNALVSVRGHWRDGARIVHDGQPVHFFDPSVDVGVVGGTFDDDFFREGVESVLIKRASAGQQGTAKMNRVLESAAKTESVQWTMQRDAVNDLWAGWLSRVAASLEPCTEERGPRTILLDEPDRSLSIPRQVELWDVLARQTRFQIIVATHSVFALSIEGAEYVDIQAGYLAECRKAVEKAWRT